jgi:putative FmdB family regulatory protein
MPSYAYRCRTCDTSFDVQRSMTERTSAAPACPSGHDDTSRVWSAVAVTGVAGGVPAQSAPSGGCCGGGCCG